MEAKVVFEVLKAAETWNSYWREWVIDWSGNNYPNLNLTRKLIVDIVKSALMRQKGDGRKARVLWVWCESGCDKQMQCGMTGKQWDTIKGTIF